MKQIILTILFFLSILSDLWGQIYSSKLEFRTVVSERTIYLNGGARATVGGKSRTIIPVKLPEGTKSWYYSFSTSSGESGTKNLNLLIQLSSLLVDGSGFTKALLSNVEVPSGSNSIDVYTFDQKNADSFIEKVDNYGGSFTYYREGLVTNTRQALVELNQVKDCYIGLKNPSAFDGIKITIEVVALVETKVYEDIWSIENKRKFFDNCLSSFAARGAEIEQICECYRDNATNEYKPSEYQKLSATSIQDIQTSIIKKCSDGTNNFTIIEKDKQIKELLQLYRGQNITKDYSAQETTLLQLIQLGYSDWNIYNSLGFCQLCLGKMEDARKNLQVGLGKNPRDLFLLGNLANYFLLTGDYNEALKIFKEHKNKKLSDNRKFKLAVSEDLREFERLGLKNENFERIRKELRIK